MDVKQNIKKMDKVLLILTLILLIWGLLSIVSASSRVAVLDHGLPVYYYFIKQLIMIIVGLILAFFVMNVDSKYFLFFTRIAYITILIILLVLSFTGDATRGAQNWITIGSFTFQPSEFSKPIMIVYLSMLFDKYYKKIRGKDNYNILGIILFIGLFIPLIVFFQKDFGTMLIMVITFITLFYGSPIKKKNKLLLTIFMIIFVIIGCLILTLRQGGIFSNAQLSRFDFFNPCSKYETGGYQICNGFIAINDGGLLGLGLGKSKQKYSYIPEPHTDSIFAIISEENGFIRSSFIIILYILLLYRIINLAVRSYSIRGKYICLGVATYIFSHIFINLGGLFGIIPLTGVPLPFFSYGGSFIICLLVSIGFVQRIYIENNLRSVS